MTRRTRLLVGLAALTAVALIVAAAVWPESPPRPCRATFEKVQLGMTQAEVESTVGGPAGIYADERVYGQFGISYWPPRLPRPGWWLAEDAELQVEFGPDDRVTEVLVGPVSVAPAPPLLARVRARLGL